MNIPSFQTNFVLEIIKELFKIVYFRTILKNIPREEAAIPWIPSPFRLCLLIPFKYFLWTLESSIHTRYL